MGGVGPLYNLLFNFTDHSIYTSDSPCPSKWSCVPVGKVSIGLWMRKCMGSNRQTDRKIDKQTDRQILYFLDYITQKIIIACRFINLNTLHQYYLLYARSTLLVEFCNKIVAHYYQPNISASSSTAVSVTNNTCYRTMEPRNNIIRS